MGKLLKQWKWEIVLLLFISGFLVAVAIPNMRTGPRFPPRNTCIANLKQIDGAIQQWSLVNKKKESEVPDFKSAIKYLKDGKLLKCPSGGSYAAGKTVADPPTCTKAATLGHSLVQ